MFYNLSKRGLNKEEITLSVFLSDGSPNKEGRIVFSLISYFNDTDKINVFFYFFVF